MAGPGPARYPVAMNMTPLARAIWRAKYRFDRGPGGPERDIRASWQRVARAIAAVEEDAGRWEQAFLSVLTDFRFLPGGRVLAGAGTGQQVTLLNCFVSGPVLDSLDAILESLKETALTMQQGGGIGLDFSLLRPAGSAAIRTGAVASGPVTFMHTWDSLCRTLLSTSTRRGAMMATLRCDHPDIQAFVDAKRDGGALRNFNLSVLVTDEFMQAVETGCDWRLVFPAPEVAERNDAVAVNRVQRTLPARALWRSICEAAHATAEPGVLFVDTINRDNNLYYCETISATNPCGEIPLPSYGACCLGSVNLPTFVQSPFGEAARFDVAALRQVVQTAVRFLDDVIDVTRFPLPAQGEQVRRTRRTGFGVTGLGDALAMLGLHYDSDEARGFAAGLLETIRDAAYESSIELARRKGPFPAFDSDKYLAAPFIQRLPAGLRDTIREHGIRNSHLLAIAPAGTISLLAGNVSSGVEPIFALEATRTICHRDLRTRQHAARNFAYELWRQSVGGNQAPPPAFVTAEALPASAHLRMQACLQPFVDNAISKTVTLPASAGVEDVEHIFTTAYRSGIKGCTVFRPGTCAGQVIRSRDERLLDHG